MHEVFHCEKPYDDIYVYKELDENDRFEFQKGLKERKLREQDPKNYHGDEVKEEKKTETLGSLRIAS